jgi:diacylglycerol kinase
MVAMASPRPPPRAAAALARAFGFAGAGLVDAALRERNLRIHLGLGILATCAAAVLDLTPAERALVLASAGAVVATEALNSAIETIVDVVLPGPDPRARFAKDASAGAVLALAVASVAVTVAILAPRAGGILGDARALAPSATGAALAALAAWRLPAPLHRRAPARLALTFAGGLGLGLVAPAARSVAALGIAALLLAVGAGAAARRAAGEGPPIHRA